VAIVGIVKHQYEFAGLKYIDLLLNLRCTLPLISVVLESEAVEDREMIFSRDTGGSHRVVDDLF